MTENTNTLDLAERIAESLQRTGEPAPSATGEFNPEEDTVVGEVPEHLRHLHNLLAEIGEEATAAQIRALKLMERHNAVKSVFFDSLETHVPTKGDGQDFDSVKIYADWKVAGVKRKRRGGHGIDLSELLGGAMMSRRMAEVD